MSCPDLTGSCPCKAICSIIIKTTEPLKTIKVSYQHPPIAPLTHRYLHTHPAMGLQPLCIQTPPSSSRCENTRKENNFCGGNRALHSTSSQHSTKRSTHCASGQRKAPALPQTHHTAVVCSQTKLFARMGSLHPSVIYSGMDELKLFPAKESPRCCCFWLLFCPHFL